MRILWLLEELELPYELKHYARTATYRAPQELRAIHPLGKSPTIVDDGRVITESAVIVEYLIDRYGGGRLRPAAGTPEAERYRYWLHYAESSLMPNLLLKFVFQKIPGGVPGIIRPLIKGFCKKVSATVVDPEVALHLAYVESQLEGREWFVANEPTGADMQMSFPLEAASQRASVGPNVAAFIARMQARPAYQRALAKAKA